MLSSIISKHCSGWDTICWYSPKEPQDQSLVTIILMCGWYLFPLQANVSAHKIHTDCIRRHCMWVVRVHILQDMSSLSCSLTTSLCQAQL